MDTSARVRRKVWLEALKREIVAAASAPGASVSVGARQYDVNTNLPVMVTADQPAAAPAEPPADIIEIEMPGGYRVRCGRGVKGASLRVVLDALERR